MSIQVISPETDVAKTTEVSPDQTVVSNPSVSKKVSAQVASTQAPVKATAAAALAKKDQEEEARQAQIAEAADQAAETVAEEQVAEATPAEVTETAKTIAEVSQEIDATAESLAALDAPMMFAQAGAAAAGGAAGGISTAAIVAGVAVVGVAAAASSDSSSSTAATPAGTPAGTPAVTGTTYALTAGVNNFPGTANNDTFEALTDGHLSVDDTLAGQGGTDTLYVRALASSTGAFTATGIETIDARSAGANAGVVLTNVTGYTSLVSNGSANALVFSGILNSAGAALTVSNDATGTTHSFDYKSGELAGTANSVTLNINANTAAHNISIDDAGGTSQLETLNVVSSSSNTGATTLQDDALTATTVNISGAGNVTLTGTGGLEATTINASTATGNVSVTFGTATQSITGGTGNDTFTEETTGDLTFADTIAGGLGTDTLALALVSGAALSNTAGSGNVANVTGFETLKLSSELTAALTVDMSKHTGLLNVTFADFSDAGTTDAHAITKLLDNATITVADANSNHDDATEAVATLALGFAANSSTNNVTLVLQGVGIAALTSSDGFTDGLTINSNADSAGGTTANVIEALTNFTAKTLTATGAVALDINDAVLSTSTTTVNASAMTAGIAVSASATSTEITGGSGADTIAGGAGSDVLVGGAGADLITFTNSTSTSDNITGGAGSDTFINATTTAGTVVAHTITDFSAGTSTTAVDLLHISKTAVNGLTTVTALSDTSNNAAVATDGTVVKLGSDGATIANADLVVLDVATYANDTAVLAALKTGGTATIVYGGTLDDNDAYLVLYSDGTDAYVAVATEGGGANSNTVDSVETIVKLSGINLAGLANFDSTDYFVIA